jgi:predicted  nucleic acid-binding Zn-ribbon protein
MYAYQCLKCGKYQYSSSSEKGNEPCIYCGHKKTELIGHSEGGRTHGHGKDIGEAAR